MNLKILTNEELESLSDDIKSEQKRREDLKSNPSSYIVALNQRFQGRFVKIDDIVLTLGAGTVTDIGPMLLK